MLILCNVPLPITIDELISYRDLNKGLKVEQLIEAYSTGVIPLSPNFLYENHPKLFNSVNDAKQTVKRFKDEHADGIYPYRGETYKLVAYRVVGEAGKPKLALVRGNVKGKKMSSELQKMHGKAITLLEDNVK